MKTRLDPVIRIEETREEKSLVALAQANRQLQAAEQALAEALARASDDGRRGAAVLWEIAEQAHARAIAEVAKARAIVAQAQTAVGQARAQYLEIHARAEAVRRLAATRREEILNERDKAEIKQAEELQILRHGRPRAA